jgi:hypothetical protein
MAFEDRQSITLPSLNMNTTKMILHRNHIHTITTLIRPAIPLTNDIGIRVVHHQTTTPWDRLIIVPHRRLFDLDRTIR